MKSKKPSATRNRVPHSYADPAAAKLAHHRAQCGICRHPQREEIEREFLDWTSAREIAEEFKLASYRAVYRHAHAFEMFLTRRGYVERVLDRILERSGEAKITAASVISAIRLLVELRSADNRLHLAVLRSLPRATTRNAVARESAAERRYAFDDEDAGDEDGENERRAPTGRSAAGAADRDDDDGDDNALWAGASPQLIRALKTARTAAPVQAPPAAPVAPAPDKSERNAAPLAYASSKESEAKAEPPKPPAPAVPPPTPTPAPPGTRREPDGPVQVAGMAWPWAKGRSPFARRGRWRGRPG